MIRRTQLLLLIAGACTASAIVLAQPSSHGTQPPTVVAEAPGTVAPLATDTSKIAVAPKKSAAVEITIDREVFDYDRSGRRDPYKSLMTSSDVRPLLSDLRLTAVAFDPDGNNSVAILRDSFSNQQYRIRVGQQLGRLRVAGIKQKSVQFNIEEFGFNRQETLVLASDTTKTRNP